MNVSLATLVPNEHEFLEEEIARTEAELEAVSNRLQRLIQLRSSAKQRKALDNLASEVAEAMPRRNLCLN
jgi:hypothetical protein